MDPEICERIKANRKRIGFTQEQLGHAIGVQKSAIQKYESGAVNNIKLDTLDKLAEVFGVSVSTLLGDKTSTERVFEVIYENYGATGLEMFDVFEGLNETGRLKVVSYAHDIHHAYDIKGDE